MWVARLVHSWSVSHPLVPGTTARSGGDCSPRIWWGVAFLNMSRKRWLYIQSSYHFRLRCSNIHNKNPVKKEVNGHSKRNRIDLLNRRMEKVGKIKWCWINLFLAFNYCVKSWKFPLKYLSINLWHINPTKLCMMYEEADKHVIEANIINIGRRINSCKTSRNTVICTASCICL